MNDFIIKAKENVWIYIIYPTLWNEYVEYIKKTTFCFFGCHYRYNIKKNDIILFYEKSKKSSFIGISRAQGDIFENDNDYKIFVDVTSNKYLIELNSIIVLEKRITIFQLLKSDVFDVTDKKFMGMYLKKNNEFNLVSDIKTGKLLIESFIKFYDEINKPKSISKVTVKKTVDVKSDDEQSEKSTNSELSHSSDEEKNKVTKNIKNKKSDEDEQTDYKENSSTSSDSELSHSSDEEKNKVMKNKVIKDKIIENKLLKNIKNIKVNDEKSDEEKSDEENSAASDSELSHSSDEENKKKKIKKKQKKKIKKEIEHLPEINNASIPIMFNTCNDFRFPYLLNDEDIIDIYGNTEDSINKCKYFIDHYINCKKCEVINNNNFELSSLFGTSILTLDVINSESQDYKLLLNNYYNVKNYNPLEGNAENIIKLYYVDDIICKYDNCFIISCIFEHIL